MLIVFDVDGVLVDIDSSWSTILRYFGIKCTPNMLPYLLGKIGYQEFMRLDIRLWKSDNTPVSIDLIKKVLGGVKLHPKAKLIVNKLKKLGHEIALLSSGIDILVKRVAKELNIDHYLANELVVRDNKVIDGLSRVPLLDKHLILKLWAKQLGYSLSSTVYVGDSIFDIPVFRIVRLSIAIVDSEATAHRMRKYVTYVVERDRLEEILEIPEIGR